jgi:hypothetical protein
LGSERKHGKRTIPPKKVPEPLREFLDACVIPALVEKYLAKHKESKR